MIDLLSLGLGVVIGAAVGIGISIWYVRRKLQQMQEGLFGQMGGMTQEPGAHQEPADMEAMMGEMMDMMGEPADDEFEDEAFEGDLYDENEFQDGTVDPDENSETDRQ